MSWSAKSAAGYRAANPAKVRASQRISQQKRRADPVLGPQMRREAYERNLRYHYNLTAEDVARQLHFQELRCACCGDQLELDKNTHVDHCHKTGKFRGMLCAWCNAAVGQIHESAERALALLVYVSRFQ